MSIVDVYQEVQKIGSTDPGMLVKLSFFSHAWYGGPILVNSYDDSAVTTTPGRESLALHEAEPLGPGCAANIAERAHVLG